MLVPIVDRSFPLIVLYIQTPILNQRLVQRDFYVVTVLHPLVVLRANVQDALVQCWH